MSPYELTTRPDPILAEFAPQSICLHQCTSFFPSLQSPLLFSFVAPFLLPNPVMLGCLDCSIETRTGLSRTDDVPAYEPRQARRCSRRYIINSSKPRLSTGTNHRLLHLKNLNTLRRRPSLKRRSVLTTRRYCVFCVPDALELDPAAPRQFCCAGPNFSMTVNAVCKCNQEEAATADSVSLGLSPCLPISPLPLYITPPPFHFSLLVGLRPRGRA